MWLACVLSAALVDDVSNFAFAGLALCTLVTADTLGGSDIVDSAASVDCAWL